MIRMLKVVMRSLTYTVSVLLAFMQSSGAEGAGTHSDVVVDNFLRMQVDIPGVCRAGDMNAVAQEMMFKDRGKDAKIFLSISSLDGTQEHVTEILQELKREDFSRDPVQFLSSLVNTQRDVEVEFKRPVKPTVFTVAVCKDTSGRHSCKQKSESRYRDIMDILRAYTDPKAEFISDDSVYFYQLLVLGPSGVELATDPLYSDKGFKDFARKNSFDRVTRDTQLRRLRKIYSLPITTKGDRLVVQLPLYDSKRCG
jgi:hypothetical protein